MSETTTPATPVAGTAPPAPTPTVTQAAFDAAYWLHQPPAVQALQKITDEGARTTQAMTLATQGYSIDVPIMCWGWDPFLVTTMRVNYGYTWVPSALMSPILLAPGLIMPGVAPYNPAAPPPGAIMVSLALSSYPPFTPPPAPPPPPTAPTSLVGINEGGGFFQAYQAALVSLKNGEVYTADPRGSFTFHVSNNPFAPNGVTIWFTQN